MKKRMKFPNGFGSISELSGNRRRPWAVRKTINGHNVYLGYFISFDDAIAFLVEYNKSPAVYQPDLMTFADVYRLEMAERRIHHQKEVFRCLILMLQDQVPYMATLPPYNLRH